MIQCCDDGHDNGDDNYKDNDSDNARDYFSSLVKKNSTKNP